MPKVSVVIPTFNQASYLESAIESVCKQTHKDLEILVVNDGSQDDTRKILDRLEKNEPRMRVFHQENKGFSAASNLAIKNSTGEFLAHLDSDDLMLPEKIEKQLAYLAKHPNIDIVYTAVEVIDRKGKALMVLRGKDENPETFLAKMLFRSIMPNPSTMLGKSSCMKQELYRENYKRSCDYDRAIRLAVRFCFGYLDLPLTQWRRHDTNISNDLERHKIEQRQILESFGEKQLMEFVEKAKLEEENLLKGKILYNLERYEDAIEFFKKDGSPAGNFYHGNCLMRQNRPEPAQELYKECLKKAPDHAACWNNLGVALGKQGNDCFKKALSLQKGYQDAASNIKGSKPRLTDRELREKLIPYTQTT